MLKNSAELLIDQEPHKKPALRIVHHMARSGGTLLSRCIGCMDHIVLLSEINPLSMNFFNPLDQACSWHELFTSSEMKSIDRKKPMPLAETISLIHSRAEARNATLVIRDWSHLNFTGVPFIDKPSYRLELYEVLFEHFDILRLCTVRHAFDQWQSLHCLKIIQEKIDLAQFLYGYRRFAEHAASIGFIRYEDFAEKPVMFMDKICKRLAMKQDPDFMKKWHRYRKITGDTGNIATMTTIKPRQNLIKDPSLLNMFAANKDYNIANEILGYCHPTENSPSRSTATLSTYI